MYRVIDYYENPFGEMIFNTENYEECLKFCREYKEETDGECRLGIKTDFGIPYFGKPDLMKGIDHNE